MQLSYDAVFHFGDRSDGSLQIPFRTKDDEIIEASYFTSEDKEKDIYVISTQAGCPMRCQFCELGEENFSRNLTVEEITEQVSQLIHRVSRNFILFFKPKKLTFANTGEPLLNPAVAEALDQIEKPYRKHGPCINITYFSSYKISTLLPKGQESQRNLKRLAEVASRIYELPAWWRRGAKPLERKKVQLQISLISLDEKERKRLTKGCGASFKEIIQAAELWRSFNPQRKVNLSLISCAVQPTRLVKIFSPELFRLRIRSYISTNNGEHNKLSADDNLFKKLQDSGYEVTNDGQPTPIERKFGLAANVTRRRYLEMIND